MSRVIQRLHHVSLIVADVTRALAFYQTVLELEMDTERPDLGYPGAWLQLPGAQQIHLMQLDNPDAASQRPEHGGRDRHIAFMVTSIDEIAKRLQQQGLSFTRSRSGRKALFCRDPDNNALEFVEVAPAAD